MSTELRTGRANQKKRTRQAIVTAARDLAAAGGEITMAAVAQAALVSEATAYRYFPDLLTLLHEVLDGMWPSPAEAFEPVAGSADPVERVGFAAEFLLRGVLRYQGAVRAMIAATVSRPQLAAARPGVRFGLIEQALTRPAGAPPVISPAELAQLKLDLAVPVSAEALFTLTDLCGLPPEEAIGSAVRTARTLTDAAIRRSRS